MGIDSLSQALHVVHGAHTMGSLREALHLGGDQILFNGDPISVGPAPATNDFNVWRSTRRRFMWDCLSEEQDYRADGLADHELLTNTERLGEAPAVVVWLAHGLPEQLLLAWMIFLFDLLKLEVSKLWVVQLEKRPPHEYVRGIAELHPDHISKFCPPPRRLDPKEVEELRRAWRVYTNKNPGDLSTYIAENSPMPLLHEALSQLVDRYPDRRSGLSVWDERLLHYTAEQGPIAARVIGNTFGYSERLDHVRDDYLFPRLTALARSDLASPLIKITGSSQIMRVCRVTITPFGRKVLAGEANHVQVNGIDDWVGGVHLSSSEGTVTFRDGGSLVLPL